MMQIKCKVGRSRIHGVGVFAAEFVPVGTVTWKEDNAVDRPVSADWLRSLPEDRRAFIYAHCYRLREEAVYRHVTDEGQFMNHSARSNCEYRPEARCDVAVTDIARGEEATTNYWLYNAKFAPGVEPLKLIDPMPLGPADTGISDLLATVVFRASAPNGKYKDAPHEYILPAKCPKAAVVAEAMRERLRWCSYPGKFNGWPYDYTNVNGFKYWFCGTVLNRERL